MLETLYDHLIWADGRSREALHAMPSGTSAYARALGIYAHLAAAEEVWLARIEGRVARHAVWPELTIEEATSLARETGARLRDVAASAEAGLSRRVVYRNSAGQEFANTVEEILVHVALHGSYHRGQLALLARQADAIPAATDLIFFLRER